MGFYMFKISFRTLHWSDGILVLQLLNTHLDICKDFLKLNIAHTTQITAASVYFTTPYVISVTRSDSFEFLVLVILQYSAFRDSVITF